MQQINQGILRKMRGTFDKPINYHLKLDDQEILLNEYLGKPIKLHYLGKIFCIQCGRKTNKSYHQGHCYLCMNRLSECGFCVIRPENCKSDHEFCPKNDWAHEHCLQPHMVYLANSSGVKVGITRETNLITRWIDQGAKQAIPIMRLSNRQQSGVVEVNLKQYVNDRTDWRKMLREEAIAIDLLNIRQQLFSQAEPGLRQVTATFNSDQVEWIIDRQPLDLEYPIKKYPQKLQTLSFDKTPEIYDVLQGIKGQYLIFDSGVINIRKFSGYQVALFGE